MMKKNYTILIALLAVVLTAKALPAAGSEVFNPFSLNDKLPSNTITRTFQDQEGYMWFGSRDGLCRFDGYDISVFRSSAQTPGRLTSNEIECITEDREHKLWVGTLEGINILDKKNFTLKPFENKFTRKERINSIVCDSEGFIWIGTSNYGVLKVNPQNGEFQRYSKDAGSRYKLRSNNISQIYEDKRGNIWLSSWKNGLCFIDNTKKQIHYLPVIGLSNNPFRVFQDADGLYWICTWGDGIYTMTLDASNKATVAPVKLTAGSPGVDNIVYSIVQDDNDGHIWIVTFEGLYVISKAGNDTYTLQDGKIYTGKITGGIFHEIYKDHKGNLWLGTLGEGLYRLDLRSLPFENYPLSLRGNAENSFVTHICETGTGHFYFTLDRKGLYRFDFAGHEINEIPVTRSAGLTSITAITYIRGTNEIWIANEGTGKIYVYTENGSGLVLKQVLPLQVNNDNSISIFFEDRNRDVWIGSNSGLFKKIYNGKVLSIPFTYKFINSIVQDKAGDIWVGTEKNGLFRLKKDPKKPGNTQYTPVQIELRKNDFESHNIESVLAAHNGDIYIGTKEGFIYQYDSESGKIKEISGQYAITDEKILDILEDNYGNLWISTTKQIIKHNPLTHASIYYSTSNGMLINSFFKDARIKLKNGLILFGGNKGICAFDPSGQQKQKKPAEPQVVLTDILVQNKSIFERDREKLYDSEKNTITLKYSENKLSIEFSILDYLTASNTQYAYMLVGTDKNWNYIGSNRRFVNYADLREGSYTFSVKATDENGVWSNHIATLEIKVLPPFYRTWWAFLLYLIIVLIILYFSYRNFSNRIRLLNDLRISKIDKEKTEELVQTKLRYFTNISHELLTPLTIIILEIEKIQRKLKDSSPSQFGVVKDNVSRLRRLIEQILYFSKVEAGNMKLKVSRADIVAYIDRICRTNFKTLLDDKGIHFTFSSNYTTFDACFDQDKMDKIIYNLLSNAYKNTPSGGNINVNVEILRKDTSNYLSLTVEDTGVGIPEKDLPYIFDRFYVTSTSDQSQSHGIGLALTHDLIKLHKGEIGVKSKLHEGTSFTFNLPVSPECYPEDEMLPESIIPAQQPEEIENEEPAVTDVKTAETVVNKEFTLLIVEDNKDLRNNIQQVFESSYTVFTAENGVAAQKIVQEKDVNLIICDVMMPEMDGLTLCRLLKNDIKTSHINILILTARDSSQDRIDCYEAGADGYISKPFELGVLEARVKNLIQNRNLNNKKFKQNHDVSISTIEMSSIDEEYLKMAISKVESKLADETYDFDLFAQDMSSSRSTLHRKLKSLTGLSPWEFIRNIRLKHAAQMMKNNVGSISEIAFKVGFNDPKYFSRCFKAEFGMTPKEFQEKHKE